MKLEHQGVTCYKIFGGPLSAAQIFCSKAAFRIFVVFVARTMNPRRERKWLTVLHRFFRRCPIHTMEQYKNYWTARKIGPAFPSIFMFIVMFVLLKTWRLPHVYLYHDGIFGHFVSIGIYEKYWKLLFYRSGNSKMHVEHLQKTLRFLHVDAFRDISSDSIPSVQLADRLAVLSHTSAFRCMPSLGISMSMYAKLWHMSWVMIIGVWLGKLLGSMSLQAFHPLSITSIWAWAP